MKVAILALTAALLLGSAGCSLAMAVSGGKDPNIDVLTIGQDRGIVLLHLGRPSKTRLYDGARVDTFDLEFGFTCEDLHITVTYDADDRVTKVVSQ